jgi:predicted small secreted protein
VRRTQLVLLAIVALGAALVAGCGAGSGSTASSSGSEASAPASGASAPAGASAKSCETQAVDVEGLRVTGVVCGAGRDVMSAWQRDAGCAPAAGASRAGCTVNGYRCQAVVADQGVAVSCAQPGRSVAFIARRG